MFVHNYHQTTYHSCSESSSLGFDVWLMSTSLLPPGLVCLFQFVFILICAEIFSKMKVMSTEPGENVCYLYTYGQRLSLSEYNRFSFLQEIHKILSFQSVTGEWLYTANCFTSTRDVSSDDSFTSSNSFHSVFLQGIFFLVKSNLTLGWEALFCCPLWLHL